MSNYFNITRDGNDIFISPKSNNFSDKDRITTITLRNDANKTATITVKQFKAPKITMIGSTTIPNYGGTLQLRIDTHYDVSFLEWPLFVTAIRDSNGEVYREGQVISASHTTDKVFYIDVGSNFTGQDRIVNNTFKLGNYINGELQEYANYINFKQLAVAAEGYVIPSVSYLPVNYAQGSSASFTVSANTAYTVSLDNTYDFSVNKNGNTITVSANRANSGASINEGTVTLSDGTVNAEVQVVQYTIPKITQFGGSQYVGYEADTLYYTIDTHYDFCFQNVPVWVTGIFDNYGTEYVEGQRINKIKAANATFYMDIEENDTGNNRQSTGFNMGHYINNTLQSLTAPINIIQYGDVLPTNPDDEFDDDDTPIAD